MTSLPDVFGLYGSHLLSEHIKNGLVSQRFHKELPLAILNYTPECAYSRTWDDVTKKCRGLIYNTETQEVVARPFEKFFNWDEAGSPFPPAGPALRMEKADGSLGILYRYEMTKTGYSTQDYAIATRGSMHSEQAEWATEFLHRGNFMLDEKFGGVGFLPKVDKTYLFEIIYPENRIVVDYGDYKGLILLDVIDNETGFADTDEFDNCQWPDKIVRKMVSGFDSGQVVDIADGEEGFVYLWPTRNFRTKMKSAEYIRIHRLVSNLSEKSVWESLVAGKTLDQIKVGLPEEFHGFIDGVYNSIMEQVGALMYEAASEMVKIGVKFPDYYSAKDVPRADIAKEIVKSPMRKYLFQMLDGKDIYPVALRDAKPVRNDPMVKDAADE